MICYIDLSATSGYQMGNLTEMGIMIHFYECWMEACKSKGFSKILNKVKRHLTTKNFGIREFVDAGGYPVPRT